MQRDLKYLFLERLLDHSVLKVLKICLGDTVLNVRVGCLESFSKIEHESLIKKLLYLREDSLHHL